MQEDVGLSVLKHIIFLFTGWGGAMGSSKYCVKRTDMIKTYNKIVFEFNWVWIKNIYFLTKIQL